MNAGGAGCRQLLQFSPSLSHISYSCGNCGYELNLNSCTRNTSMIGSKYEKSMKKGIISFFSIDETRFTHIKNLRYIPYFTSRSSWGFFRPKTKLLCRKCGNHIGNSYRGNISDSISWDGISDHKIYDIKLQSLQPSIYDNSIQDS